MSPELLDLQQFQKTKNHSQQRNNHSEPENCRTGNIRSEEIIGNIEFRDLQLGFTCKCLRVSGKDSQRGDPFNECALAH